ncbi:uncharacterized protein LOC136032437 isoform X2 [Artemia franciscana]|uniref:uncharacterized protein LOC136032437 isoform X2 n=1 Tax=Artemia franciscana TaxID=6661 RepID=UPI0032DB1B85
MIQELDAGSSKMLRSQRNDLSSQEVMIEGIEISESLYYSIGLKENDCDKIVTGRQAVASYSILQKKHEEIEGIEIAESLYY